MIFDSRLLLLWPTKLKRHFYIRISIFSIWTGYSTINYHCISSYLYKRNAIPLLKKISKTKNLLERDIYIPCIFLAMSNNTTILDDTKHVIVADKPSIDMVQRSPSMTRESFKENLKIIVSFGGGQ